MSDQPAVLLREWRVIGASDGNLYLLGLRFQHEQVRMTTASQVMDCAQRLFVTESGRRCLCEDPPGDSLTSAHIMLYAAHAALPMPVADVTSCVWSEMQRRLN